MKKKTNNTFFYVNIFLLPIIVLAWTDFSETRVFKNGLYDLHYLQAQCPLSKIMRGFAIEKPTKSTIRIAMNCIPLDKSIKYMYQEITNSTSPQECVDDRFIWLDKHQVLCKEGHVLIGFTIFMFDKKCHLSYTCLPIPKSSCYNKNYLSTSYFPLPKGQLESKGFPKILAPPYNAGLQGFEFVVNYHKDDIHWEARFNYSWCLFPESVETIDSESVNLKNTGIDIDLYIKYSQENIKKSLQFIIDFKEIFTKFKEYISFTPHILINVTSNEEQDKLSNDFKNAHCINEGKYCLNKIDNIQGKQLIMESLKQSCLGTDLILFSSDSIKELFFEYIFVYQNKCINQTGVINCGDEVLQMFGVQKWTTERCIQESFENREKLSGENSIIERENLIIQEKNFTFDEFPYLTVNDNKINLSKNEVISIICRVLGNITQCNESNLNKQGGTFLSVILRIMLVFFALFLIYIIYKYIKVHFSHNNLYLLNKKKLNI